MRHDVFISHSSKDKLAADAICAALEAAKIRCWITPRDVVPGRAFSGEIKRAIERCTVVVLVFSSHSNRSEEVLREVQLAAKARCHIVNFRIEDIKVSDDLDYYLAVPHWLDAITPPMERHHGQLVASVKTLLELERPSSDAGSVHPRREDIEKSSGPRPENALLEVEATAGTKNTRSDSTLVSPPTLAIPRLVLSARQTRWIMACSVAVAGCFSALLSSKLKGSWPILGPGLGFGLAIAPWFLYRKAIRKWGAAALVAGATLAYSAAYYTSFFSFLFYVSSLPSEGSMRLQLMLGLAEAGIIGGAAGTTLLAATLALVSANFRTANWKTLATIGTAAGAGLSIATFEATTFESGTPDFKNFGSNAFIFLWQLWVALYLASQLYPSKESSYLASDRSLAPRRWAARAVWLAFLLSFMNAAAGWIRSDKNAILHEAQRQHAMKSDKFTSDADKAFEKNEWARAIENYSAAIALGADYSRLFYRRAYSRWKLGQNREAIDDYTKAIDATKSYKDAEPFNGRGVCRHNLAEYSAAIEDYTKAIELAPSQASYYLNRALAYDAIGRKLSAAADRSKAQALTEEGAK